MEHEPIEVTCYSGHTYAERPKSFLWEGTEHRVKKVEKEWQEPGEKHFRIVTEDDRMFELCYYEDSDRWFATEWLSKSAKGGRDEKGSP